MTPTRGPAMTDVARLAGVSHQTVSRVINGHPNVTEATRTRVEQAIAELGYRPNTAARALVTGRSSTIGIVGTGNALYGPVSTLYSVEQAARQAGYSVVVGVPTSFDEVAIALFLAGGDPTFPVFLYGQLRFAQRLPVLIAMAVMLMIGTVTLTLIAFRVGRRQP